MAICKSCNQEMLTARNCPTNARVKMKDGTTLPSIPWGNRFGDDVNETGICPDCGVHLGGFHHPGCDMEGCPRCGIQMLGCEGSCPKDVNAINTRWGKM